MSPKEYRDALAKLDLSQAKAAELLGVYDRTSRRYALGETAIPEPVAILLRLIVAGKITPADIERMKR